MTLKISPIAYEYVRKIFNRALPHQATIRKQLSKFNCDLGFPKPALRELKRKVEQENLKNDYIQCCLSFDEMAIKKDIEVDRQVRGFVDIGAEITDDERNLVTEALVRMLTAANGHWMIPVAYFLISTLIGIERAAILNEASKGFMRLMQM